MLKRVFIVMALLGVFGWLSLTLIQRQFHIGGFAKSPQFITMKAGRRIVAGGGRAIVGVVGLEKKDLVVELRCADGKQVVKLRRQVESVEVCGLRLRFLGFATAFADAESGVRLEVSWEGC